MAFLMKYDEAYETIEVVIPEIKLVDETGVKLATHEKSNNVAYSYLMKACTKGPKTDLVVRTYKGDGLTAY